MAKVDNVRVVVQGAVENFDKAVLDEMLDSAKYVEKYNALTEIRCAIKRIKEPYYYLVSSAQHKTVIDKLLEEDECKEVKAVFTDFIDADKFLLIKNDGTLDGSCGHIYFMPKSDIDYTVEFKLTHPEFITKVIIDKGDEYV